MLLKSAFECISVLLTDVRAVTHPEYCKSFELLPQLNITSVFVLFHCVGHSMHMISVAILRRKKPNVSKTVLVGFEIALAGNGFGWFRTV